MRMPSEYIYSGCIVDHHLMSTQSGAESVMLHSKSAGESVDVSRLDLIPLIVALHEVME